MATECNPRAQTVRFATFEVDLAARELRKGGVKIKVHGQPSEVLAILLERPGGIVPREEFKQKLWPTDTFVDFDHGVNTAINRLREALGDSAENPRFVETIPRRGYRFIGPVEPTAAVLEANVSGVRIKQTKITALAVGLGIAVVAILGLVAMRQHLFARRSGPAIQSVAVLPLTNLSSDADQDYFADGMTDALITDLGKISALA